MLQFKAEVRTVVIGGNRRQPGSETDVESNRKHCKTTWFPGLYATMNALLMLIGAGVGLRCSCYQGPARRSTQGSLSQHKCRRPTIESSFQTRILCIIDLMGGACMNERAFFTIRRRDLATNLIFWLVLGNASNSSWEKRGYWRWAAAGRGISVQCDFSA